LGGWALGSTSKRIGPFGMIVHRTWERCRNTLELSTTFRFFWLGFRFLLQSYRFFWYRRRAVAECLARESWGSGRFLSRDPGAVFGLKIWSTMQKGTEPNIRAPRTWPTDDTIWVRARPLAGVWFDVHHWRRFMIELSWTKKDKECLVF
jgi:hypothetical protein